MDKLVTVAEMLTIEREADANGLSYAQMMENAGRGLARYIDAAYSHVQPQNVLALVGSGNNGGDALVALAYLAQVGWKTSAYIVRPRPPDDPLVKRLIQEGGEIYMADEDKRYGDLESLLQRHRVLIDGVLGTGIQLPLKPQIAAIFAYVQRSLVKMDEPPYVVAVDCPSGIDSETGEVAPECIPADVTVTMAAVKKGLLSFPASDLTGEVRVVDIGLLDNLPSWQSVRRFVADGDFVKGVLPIRRRDAHKGSFGTALIVAGSVNYTGAAILAGEAAYRIGAGLVTMAVPAPLHAALAGHIPEATWLLLPHELGVIASDADRVIRENIERITAILVGPGIGLEDTTGDFLARFLGSPETTTRGGIGFVPKAGSKSDTKQVNLPPMVIDADGLKLVGRLPNWAELLPPQTVLTPHPGEMGVLTGLGTDQIQRDRLDIAEHYAREWGHVVVLKGAFTVIASPDGKTVVIPVATSALARAGTGDVLAGLIVGLRAQGVDAFDAAAAGAWIHAQAGLEATGSLGNTASVLAGDVLGSVIGVLNNLCVGKKSGVLMY